jgi:hypothetical protein
MQGHGSDVARLRDQITKEHIAGKLGLQGLAAGMGRHDFITARQERVALFQEQLHDLVGDQSIALVTETLDAVPETATRSDVLAVLQYELGSSKETATLCNHLQEVWKAVDLLKERFGDEPTRKMILAPPTVQRDIPPS